MTTKRPKYIYLQGKLSWVHTAKPDPKFGRYGCVLHPDANSLEIIKDLKENDPKILNALKKDDDGYYMRFNCDPSKIINGKMQLFRVDVLNKDGTPLLNQLVGNGSDGTIKLEYYQWNRNGGGAAVRLKAIRVDNLIPFNPQTDFPAEIAGEMKELREQPEPLF